MKNIEIMVTAIPSVDCNPTGLQTEPLAPFVNGDQRELGALIGVGDMHWPHSISRDELMETALRHGQDPGVEVARAWLGRIVAGMGSDEKVVSSGLEARQYNVSATHCIRAIYASEIGDSEHELVALTAPQTLSAWLESHLAVNGHIQTSVAPTNVKSSMKMGF